MILTKENIDVYSIALSAYNSLDFMAKMVLDNSLDVNSPLNNNQEIKYDPALYVKEQADLKVKKAVVLETFTIHSTESQSWTDVLLMGYAGFDNAAQFVQSNDLVTVNRGVTDRNLYTFDTKSVANYILVNEYLSKGIIYATGYDDEPIIIEDGCFVLREDGSYMLRQDGGRIKRESCFSGFILREDASYVLREDGYKFIRQ